MMLAYQPLFGVPFVFFIHQCFLAVFSCAQQYGSDLPGPKVAVVKSPSLFS